jgi:hypothetical protein
MTLFKDNYRRKAKRQQNHTSCKLPGYLADRSARSVCFEIDSLLKPLNELKCTLSTNANRMP